MTRWRLALLKALIYVFAFTFILSCCVDDDGDTEDDIWKDPSTGLMWQVKPTGGAVDWYDARDHCDGLSLGGHRDWRMPKLSDLRSLIRGCDYTETGGSCWVTEGCLDSSCLESSCSRCAYNGGPDNGCYWTEQMDGTCSWYWSSSSIEDSINLAWGVHFKWGHVVNYNKDYGNYYVRCMR